VHTSDLLLTLITAGKTSNLLEKDSQTMRYKAIVWINVARRYAPKNKGKRFFNTLAPIIL